MNRIGEESNEEISERRQSLWLLTMGPAIWAAYFLFSYMGAAVWCGSAGRSAELGWVRTSIALSAVVALIGIGLVAKAGWWKHAHGLEEPPHDDDTPEDRHRFLGLATVLLAALSAVATIYVALVLLFIENCA